MNDQLQETADDVRAVIRRKYEETADQLASTTGSRPDSDWPARAASLLAGVGIGLGAGILLAPASGQATRAALRDKATDVKNSVGDVAAQIVRVRPA